MGNCFSTLKRRLRYVRRRESEFVNPFPSLGQALFAQSELNRSRQQQRAITFAVAAALQQQNNVNHGLVLPGGLIDPDRGQDDESQLFQMLNQLAQLTGLREFLHGPHGESNAGSQRPLVPPNDSPVTEQDQPAVHNHASVICRLHRGEELSSWMLTDLVNRARGEAEESDPFEPLLMLLMNVAEIREMPYHDQTETILYNMNKLQEGMRLVQSQSEQLSEMSRRFMDALEDDEEEEDEDEDERTAGVLLRMIPVFMDGTMLSGTMAIQYIALLTVLERVNAGLRLPILRDLNGLGPTFLTTSGENGYTQIFQGGTEYDIASIKRSFQTRNTSPTVPVASDVITLAISYKHRGKGRDRISEEDLAAVARFIKASYRSRVRFWVDTKLPPTSDGSFARWLTRGMRPYARYMTLVCPSSDAKGTEGRFWIANERLVARASRGVFVFRRGGIRFCKGSAEFGELAGRMVRLVIGEEGVPEGVRSEEEGVVAQWALGVLGCAHNFWSAVSGGPSVDELRARDYSENRAIEQVEKVVRREGEVRLPVVEDRAWNRRNPLMKGMAEAGGQEAGGEEGHAMTEWIGLCEKDEKGVVYFLHTWLLLKMDGREGGTSVVLRVRLRAGYDVVEGNGIVEKMVVEVANEELKQMVAVTVPIESEWSVFYGE